MSGPAALFATYAREEPPIHNGELCCVCANGEGELEPFGYDPELGQLWIHPDPCKAIARANRKRWEEKRRREELERRMEF